jgi:uncharacterized repeat protein (TIGR03803 family)
MPSIRSSRSSPRDRNSGNLAIMAIGVVFAVSCLMCHPTQAQTETILYSFKGATADGGYPPAGVTLDAAGNIYGTTWKGGAVNLGTVFELSKHGETLMHSFRGPDGEEPQTGLIRDAAGNLYGTTTVGGGLSCFGAVFKVSRTGKETVLHCFAGQPTDGALPLAGLARDQKGNLYGTTSLGGANSVGIVFMLDPAGNETVLHSFAGGSIGGTDGADPIGGLISDPAGNLYGATFGGGPKNAGIVYKIDASGNETVIYSFTGTPDGQYPMGNLARDPAGNLYGVTNVGGINNLGSLFKVDSTGKETVLHSFGLAGDCEAPQAGVIRDAQGNLLGTANGGRPDYGAVFKFDTATGQETIVHFFRGGPGDGQYPVGLLTLDSQGYIYGATQEGGANNWGTIFKIGP